MDRQILLRKIMALGDEIHRLGQDITALQCIDVVDYPDNYSELSYSVAIRGENIIQKLRRLVYETTSIPKTEYLTHAAAALGITIREDDGIVEITLPCLVPKRKNKSNDFITDPLFGALTQFTLNRQQPFEKFGHCVICIIHVYDRALMSRRRIRDHDNMETKGIIDVINLFLLTDDGGDLCDIYNASEVSDDDLTRIIILNKDIFPEWILRHKNSLKNISQNA